jgi:hypothetical protein
MKTCSICRASKDLLEFNKNSTRKDGLQSHCRTCSHIKFKNYYQDNKEHHYTEVKERQRKVIIANREFVLQHLSTHPCVDCGESDKVVLEFDHVRGKKKGNLARMVHGGSSLATIEKEIAKCDVRCANCHRRRTAQVRGWYKSKGP